MEAQNRFQKEKQTDELSIRYLTFWTDHQLFGIPITEVVQIVGIQEITQLPEYPAYSKGVINLRGQIIPVIDVRLRLGKTEIPYNDRTCIIITHVLNRDFGLIVDEVDEVTDILPERISPPPKVHSGKTNPYFSGIARLEATSTQKDRVALLLHAAKILGENDCECLAQTAKTC
ncbi:chemotaxis protein CheW [Faecalispora anaeroviscerum]|uniref:chemotaxis protein CheW n=1 Tax=Faecalispora anaeroviscerum TaxID=2991836 RepID=UPI0024B953B4|nr:chemotaxis protein CheW [Faecalispora anaeroviscerum]